MPVELPILNPSAFAYPIELEALDLSPRTYVIGLVWWPRLARWTISLQLEDETYLHRGVAIVRGRLLFDSVTDPRRPAGDLAIVQDRVVDDTILTTPISQASLGVADLLHYYPASELVVKKAEFDDLRDGGWTFR